MTVSNLLTANVVVSILVSVYNHKHRVDYTTVHYMVHTTCYTPQTQKVPNGSFLIAGHISVNGILSAEVDKEHKNCTQVLPGDYIIKIMLTTHWTIT